jgi:hypothetical protein
LNLQPAVYKTAALPLSYASLRGISPTYVGDVNRRGGDVPVFYPAPISRAASLRSSGLRMVYRSKTLLV